MRRALSLLMAFLAAACASAPAKPVPPPIAAPVLVGAVRITVTPSTAGAHFTLGETQCDPDGTGVALCEPVLVTVTRLQVRVPDGYLPVDDQPVALHIGDNDVTVMLTAIVPPWPPAPSRTEILTAPLTFSGLTATTQQYGTGPWFEPALDTLTSQADRQAVYAMKRAAGDKVIGLAISHAYLEPGVPASVSAAHDWTNDLPGLHALIDEVIRAGFYVQLHLAGDGGTSRKNPDGSWAYNDPIGWTYGCPWLIENFPRIGAALSDERGYIRAIVGFDGVFYGCSPEQIAELGRVFRATWPDGYFGIEHQPGRIPTGEGDTDWIAGGAMQNYDLLLSEFNYPVDESLSRDRNGAGSYAGSDGQRVSPYEDALGNVWQIAARTLGPAYRRPPNQPIDNDSGSPFGLTNGKFFLRQGTPRGPYVACAFEWWATYLWTRNQISVADIATQRAYLKALGYGCVG